MRHYMKHYRISFNIAGSIVVPATSESDAEQKFMDGVHGIDQTMMNDIAVIIQDHLSHSDVSVDEVEEEDDG